MDEKNAKKLIKALEDINKTLIKIEKNTSKTNIPIETATRLQMPGESEEDIKEVVEEMRKMFGDYVES